MTTHYNAWQVTGTRQFDWVHRELVDPEPGHVRIRVQACGVCHSDMVAAEALLRDPSVPHGWSPTRWPNRFRGTR